MTGKQLRNSILQWAIQGKLVPQDPNDEPASVLLERIRAEKARLVREKIIKKDKNETIIFRGKDNLQLGGTSCSANSYYEKNLATGAVRCIDDEIPFDIPQGWEWERWGNISFSIQYGYNAPALEKGDIRMVRISDIQNGKVIWSKVPYCSIDSSDVNSYLLKPKDILFARTGGTVGKSFLVEEVPYESIYAGYLIRTQYSDELEPHYLKSFMESSLYWEQLKAGTVATAQPNCNGKTLGQMLIPIPPKSEQKRIIDKVVSLLPFLEKYEDLCEAFEHINEEIFHALKKSILQEAIQGKLVPQMESEGTAEDLLTEIRAEKQRLVKEGNLKKSAIANESRIFRGDDNRYYENTSNGMVCIDDEIPFEIPNSWTWCRLGDIFAHNTGKALNGGGKGEFLLPYITTSNLYWDRFELSSVKKMYFSTQELEKCTARKGDLLVCEGGDIGRAAIWQQGEICLQNHVHKLRAYHTVCQRYFLFALWHYKNTGLIGGKGIGIQGLSSNALHNLILPLPPIAEQRRIADAIDSYSQILSK